MIIKGFKQFLISLSCCLVLLYGFIDSSKAASDAGKTAAAFLQVGPGAKSAGFGGAYSALADGASATHWNPAGLANLESSEALFSHFEWFQDITLEHGSFAFPLNESITLGASFTYLNYGQIQGFDLAGNSTNEISAYDLAGGLSLGFSVSDDLSLGVTGKFVRQQLDQFNGSAFAGDFGLKYNAGQFQIAAAVVNVGNEITFDSQPEKLPSAGHFGLAYVPMHSGLRLAAELEKEFYGGLHLRQGAELGFNDQYFVRTGYHHALDDKGRSFTSGLSVGAGIAFSFADFDYAYTPQDGATSQDLHRFSLTFILSR